MKTNYCEESQKTNVDKNNNKKTFFLLGDSIRLGYCAKLKEMLKDEVEVIYPEDNCRFTQYTYVHLVSWKMMIPEPDKVDLVQWNNGHWDVAHWEQADQPLNSIEDYSKMLVRIARKIKKLFPNAKIVFQTTLPMNPNCKPFANYRTTEDIIAYNEAAKNVLKNEGVIIDDAFAVYRDKPSEMFLDECHLTDEGYTFVAKHVAENVRKILDI